MKINDILKEDNRLYSAFEEKLLNGVSNARLAPMFRKVRAMLLSKAPGANVLAYILCTFNYAIMHDQLGFEEISYMSDLYLRKQCYAFERMPFCSSLRNHNPRIEDVFSCIDDAGRECELLARKIEQNTERKGELFTDVEELLKYKSMSEIETLVNQFNSLLYARHDYREIKWYKQQFLYVKGFADKTDYILKHLRNLVGQPVKNYETWATQQIKRNLIVDCDEKELILQRLFSESGVAIITGPAGTGKSTLMKHIADLFKKCEE